MWGVTVGEKIIIHSFGYHHVGLLEKNAQENNWSNVFDSTFAVLLHHVLCLSLNVHTAETQTTYFFCTST